MTIVSGTYQRVVPVKGDGSVPTQDNPIDVALGGGNASVYGEVLTTRLTPQIQAYTHRFNDSRVWNKFLAGTGALVKADSRSVQLSTGTTLGSYSTLQTKSVLSHQPGEGAVSRFAAAFTSGGAASSTQLAGLFQAENALAFGYDNTSFGVLHRYDRKLEVRSLQITAPATGAETATITLDGVTHTVALTSSTAQVNAREIANRSGGYTNSLGTAVNAYQLNDTVWFVDTATGAKSGAYTFSSTGTAAGTFTQEQVGADGTSSWISQANWNIDTLDGTGPSGLTLDPTKMNTYEIRFGDAASPITYLVNHPSQESMIPVHRISWVATYAFPALSDPRMPLGFAVASLGSTTNLTMNTAYVAGFIQGLISEQTGPRITAQRSNVAVGTSAAPKLSIMTAPVEVVDGDVSRRRLLVTDINLSNTGAKDVDVKIYRGTAANLVGYDFRENDTANESALWVSNTGTSFNTTGTSLIRSLSIPAATAVTSTFENRLIVDRAEVLFIVASTSTSTSTLSININGTEDV
jgi:hypothetical protein